MFDFQLIGHIGQDATTRLTAGTNQVAINFSVAYSEKWKDAAGMAHERTTWVNCTLWRDAAKQAIVPYLKKGQLVYLKGKPEARGYTGRDGVVKGDLRMNVEQIELLGAAKPAHGTSPQGQAPQPSATAQPMPEAQPAHDHWVNNAPTPQADPDDLPF